MKKLCFINTGCGGHYDLFRQIFKSAEKSYELTLYPDEADVIIHYSCGFSQDQMSSIFKHIVFYENVKRDGATLIFCGCGLNGYQEEFFDEIKIVDHFIVGLDILPKVCQILGIVSTDNQFLDVNNGIFSVTIADGCNKAGGPCYFCKQNYLKIPFKSRYSVDRICELIKSHKKPIVILQAMNSTNYGIDFGDHEPKLHTLIHEVSKIDTVKWIQIDGIASSCIYEDLISEIEHNDKVCHVQFFVQSGSDDMLKKMNIGSTISDNTKVLERFRNKTISGGVVVGHPGETLNDVHETIQFIQKHNLWYTYVMKYIDTIMTPSGKMEKLSAEDYAMHCSMVEQAVDELTLKNMNIIEEQGFMGYISSFYIENGVLMAKVTPLHFEGSCFIEVENIPVQMGDKVFVHHPQILNVSNHHFKDGMLEVME